MTGKHSGMRIVLNLGQLPLLAWNLHRCGLRLQALIRIPKGHKNHKDPIKHDFWYPLVLDLGLTFTWSFGPLLMAVFSGVMPFMCLG